MGEDINSVSVFGLGKLGLPIVACLANNGYKVIGVDINSNNVESVNQRKTPVYEPGLRGPFPSPPGGINDRKQS